MNKMNIPDNRTILIFDDKCLMCNKSVLFLIKHDYKHTLIFTSIYSQISKELLKNNIKAQNTDSIIMIKDDKFYYASTAILLAIKNLRFPFNILSILGFCIPKIIRDYFYFKIAKARHLFRMRKTCVINQQDFKDRFIRE
ncbi:MAG: thiol-disulfide oxidoreductase DCC family protein [Hyphomicrobiales bacterium]